VKKRKKTTYDEAKTKQCRKMNPSIHKNQSTHAWSQNHEKKEENDFL